MRDVIDNLVIGGGPAGSMLAIRLADAGRKVVLLEREREAHHKICGEFLSREAIAYLKHAAIDPLARGATAVRRVRLHAGASTVESKLPFTALSLSRRTLDECLLAKAEAAGCEVRRCAFVESLQRSSLGWSISLRGGQILKADTVFLATGKHDLRGHERGSGTHHDLVGFKLHLALNSAQVEQLRGVMELFLFRGGYGGLALVENDVANLCLIVQRRKLRRLDGWDDLLGTILDETPALTECLSGSAACWTKPLAISPIPYGYLGKASQDGLWRLGDQIAVIPSFTGDGMSIAMHTAAVAAEMYLAGQVAQAYARCLTSQLRPAMRLGTFLSRAMVTSAGRSVAPALLRLVPDAINWISECTRIPERALLTHTQNGISMPGQRTA